MRILYVAALLAAGSQASFAADCADETQAGLNQCADAAFQLADKALNDAYRRVIGRLGGDQDKKDLLRAAEQAWIGFRDAECKFSVSGVEGGSIYPMEYLNCLQGETESRTKAIDAYLHCEEGDLACPVPHD